MAAHTEATLDSIGGLLVASWAHPACLLGITHYSYDKNAGSNCVHTFVIIYPFNTGLGVDRTPSMELYAFSAPQYITQHNTTLAGLTRPVCPDRAAVPVRGEAGWARGRGAALRRH